CKSTLVLMARNIAKLQETKQLIKNETSLVGVTVVQADLTKKPAGRAVAYSSIKAARNVFLETLSLEYPDVRMLNYSPGPCDTEMFHTVRNDATFEPTKAAFADILPLKTEESVGKLVRILKEDKFRNAEVIDYYDY
ncbi:sepiapterin reductase-like, partial [Gigantopelta aegis]|uniref:sepiapterin reductase-like n=1 Tax=Gigantopelta aegis TaxID=1735272 RepID=UPI001B888958